MWADDGPLSDPFSFGGWLPWRDEEGFPRAQLGGLFMPEPDTARLTTSKVPSTGPNSLDVSSPPLFSGSRGENEEDASLLTRSPPQTNQAANNNRTNPTSGDSMNDNDHGGQRGIGVHADAADSPFRGGSASSGINLNRVYLYGNTAGTPSSAHDSNDGGAVYDTHGDGNSNAENNGRNREEAIRVFTGEEPRAGLSAVPSDFDSRDPTRFSAGQIVGVTISGLMGATLAIALFTLYQGVMRKRSYVCLGP